MWVPEPDEPTGKGITWTTLASHWPTIVLDVHEVYGRDLDDDDVRARTSWHWFESRVRGLLTAPPRAYAPDGAPVSPNRLLTALTP